MNDGWISVHRKLLDNPIATKPAWAWLWIFLLLSANHEDKQIIFNNRPMLVKRGQLVTGRKSLHKKTKLGEQSIRSALDYLKLTNQITINTTNKFSVITILNYETYQQTNQQTNQPATSKQPASNQQATTNNNDNNDNNIHIVWNHYISVSKTEERLLQARREKIRLRLKTFSVEQIKMAIDHCFANDFYSGNNDRGWRANADYVFRSDENMDKLLNLKTKAKGQFATLIERQGL